MRTYEVCVVSERARERDSQTPNTYPKPQNPKPETLKPKLQILNPKPLGDADKAELGDAVSAWLLATTAQRPSCTHRV